MHLHLAQGQCILSPLLFYSSTRWWMVTPSHSALNLCTVQAAPTVAPWRRNASPIDVIARNPSVPSHVEDVRNRRKTRMKSQRKTYTPLQEIPLQEAPHHVDSDNSMWNEKYKGYRFKLICNKLKEAFKPRHKMTAELGGYAEKEDSGSHWQCAEPEDVRTDDNDGRININWKNSSCNKNLTPPVLSTMKNTFFSMSDFCDQEVPSS